MATNVKAERFAQALALLAELTPDEIVSHQETTPGGTDVNISIATYGTSYGPVVVTTISPRPQE